MIQEDNIIAGEQGCGNYGAFFGFHTSAASADCHLQACVISA
jgi:hypothetical protein